MESLYWKGLFKVRITVRVRPNSKKNEVLHLEDGSYRVMVKAPPVDGRANEMMLELLARHFCRPKTNLNIVVGQKARNKIVELI